ncbi:MAG: DNA-binding response regulator [Deltaproteobacteria bacterium]|nr:DNA-binding response regulator [Deltaproteobacteria bacterium]
MQPTVLVVDDEEANRLTLERILVREKVRVIHAADGRQALERMHSDQPALILTDLKMPGLDGMGLLKAVRQVDPDIEVIVMTAYGTVETAVNAMKEGAYDFITKPLRRSDIVRAVSKALEKRALVVENRSLRKQLKQSSAPELLGHSPIMQSVLEEARQVADSHASILITGESGTGKGMLASWMHRHSPHANGALVPVNCAALPDTLLESELFGYEPGAFTDAKGRKEGRFDLAKNGTLFLDEITELPISIQAKLLRVLQDGTYERLGGTDTLTSNARLITATNQEPQTAVDQGLLRKDLFYRLNVIRIEIPPLRERPEDISLLAGHFIDRFAARHGRKIGNISDDAIASLESWTWPGNVRELENAIERAVVLCKTGTIESGDLPSDIAKTRRTPDRLTFTVGTRLQNVERRMIEATMKKYGGDRQKVANVLGTTVRTLYRRESEWRSSE